MLDIMIAAIKLHCWPSTSDRDSHHHPAPGLVSAIRAFIGPLGAWTPCAEPVVLIRGGLGNWDGCVVRIKIYKSSQYEREVCPYEFAAYSRCVESIRNSEITKWHAGQHVIEI